LGCEKDGDWDEMAMWLDAWSLVSAVIGCASTTASDCIQDQIANEGSRTKRFIACREPVCMSLVSKGIYSFTGVVVCESEASVQMSAWLGKNWGAE
jgi:hypothetical protein